MPSKIEWTDETWNPVRGCTKVSTGCANCYAERMAGRFSGRGQPYEGLTVKTNSGRRWSGKIRLVESELEKPLHWRTPRKIFVCSMSDLFHPDVPTEYVHRVWDVMKRCPQHTFQVLTKRPRRMAKVVAHIYRLEALGHAKGFWDHVWIGTSIENQQAANERLPELLKADAAVKFVSVEPMLGPVRLADTVPNWTWPCWWESQGNRFWVICGGESGPGARPMNIDWVRDLRDECIVAGVPFFLKQMPPGRVLDGRTWDEMPDLQREQKENTDE